MSNKKLITCPDCKGVGGRCRHISKLCYSCAGRSSIFNFTGEYENCYVCSGGIITSFEYFRCETCYDKLKINHAIH